MWPSQLLSIRLWALITSLALVLQPMKGQTFYGSLVGAVTDSGGSLMPAVEITLTNNGTGAVQTTRTGDDGAYRFVNLPSGVYRLEAASAGFRLYRRDNIREIWFNNGGESSAAVHINEDGTVLLATGSADLSGTRG